MAGNGSRLRILSFADAADGSAGGKAAGLARLLESGFDVPPGFVVCGLEPDAPLPAAVLEAYHALGGGSVAVRSSAVGEDGAEASFAGQFESVLWVAGADALRAAVTRCLHSLDAPRADAYGRALAGRRAAAMCVVVQRMVDARAAGVAFSVDPVSMRRDRVPVEAVAGVGETLVAGTATPDRYEADRDGCVRRREPAGAAAVLTDDEAARIARGAVAAEAAWGVPLDLEWAIDRAGRLWWLQARPITTPLADLTEFDVLQDERDAYIRFNIGEMIPGAVCPLTLSTAIHAIDQAVQRMMVWVGSRRRRVPELQTVCVRYGHVFFNMSKIVEFGAHVAGITRESSMHALCGRDVPEVQPFPDAPRWVRARNGLRYAHYVLAARGRIAQLRRLRDGLQLPGCRDAAATWRELDARLPALIDAYFFHIHNSAASGFGSGTLEALVAGGRRPTAEQEREVARLLGGAGGVESADLPLQLERLVDRLVLDRPAAERFRSATPAAALAWLRSPESGVVGAAFDRFLARHGHRAFRELDLRQPGWADDPLPLLTSLQAMATAKLRGPSLRQPRSTPPPDGNGAGPKHNAAVRFFARYARESIRRREASKSLLVEISHRFKRAYRHLGELLARDARLADADLVFFLTHAELGRLAVDDNRALGRTAALRRRAHEVQSGFEFPEVFVGRADPLEPAPVVPAAGDGRLSGKPISGGVVEGPARVVRSFDEAATLERGEILIVSQTDVGWSPYYSLVSGLATDLGSPMSHGAVVAREYGLPAVTNLRVATRTFRTGDRVRLDGDRGLLCRVDPPAGEQSAC
jgi:pyruvate,water dikinase